MSFADVSRQREANELSIIQNARPPEEESQPTVVEARRPLNGSEWSAILDREGLERELEEKLDRKYTDVLDKLNEACNPTPCARSPKKSNFRRWLGVALLVGGTLGLGVAGAGVISFFAHQGMLPPFLAKLCTLGALGDTWPIVMMAGGGATGVGLIAGGTVALARKKGEKKPELTRDEIEQDINAKITKITENKLLESNQFTYFKQLDGKYTKVHYEEGQHWVDRNYDANIIEPILRSNGYENLVRIDPKCLQE